MKWRTGTVTRADDGLKVVDAEGERNTKNTNRPFGQGRSLCGVAPSKSWYLGYGNATTCFPIILDALSP